jgi:hypothetical protein
VLEEGHPLQCLLDVYSYTAMISLCITEHDVDRALQVQPSHQPASCEHCSAPFPGVVTRLLRSSAANRLTWPFGV